MDFEMNCVKFQEINDNYYQNIRSLLHKQKLDE